MTQTSKQIWSLFLLIWFKLSIVYHNEYSLKSLSKTNHQHNGVAKERETEEKGVENYKRLRAYCLRLILDFTEADLAPSPRSFLSFFLCSFLNCDTHPGLAAVAPGLLLWYNVCVLWAQSPWITVLKGEKSVSLPTMQLEKKNPPPFLLSWTYLLNLCRSGISFSHNSCIVTLWVSCE